MEAKVLGGLFSSLFSPQEGGISRPRVFPAQKIGVFSHLRIARSGHQLYIYSVGFFNNQGSKQKLRVFYKHQCLRRLFLTLSLDLTVSQNRK